MTVKRKITDCRNRILVFEPVARQYKLLTELLREFITRFFTCHRIRLKCKPASERNAVNERGRTGKGLVTLFTPHPSTNRLEYSEFISVSVLVCALFLNFDHLITIFSIATRYGLDDPGIESPMGERFSVPSRRAQRPTQVPVK